MTSTDIIRKCPLQFTILCCCLIKISILFINYLFATIRRQVENECSEKTDANAGNHKVNCVKKSTTSKVDFVSDVDERGDTTGVPVH